MKLLALPAPSLERHLVRTIDARSLNGVLGTYREPRKPKRRRKRSAPDPQFFFGAMSRPVMIKLDDDFTLFSASFCECTGLTLMHDELDAHSGMFLRTPDEVYGLTQWIRHLGCPDLQAGESAQLSQSFPGFSPEFENESLPASDDFSGHDATELTVSAVWHKCRDEGLMLHLAAQEPDGCDVQGIPLHLLMRFCDALERFADEWEDCGIDLTREQPLAHIPAP